MADNRHITKIVGLMMGAAVLLSLLAVAFGREIAERAGGSGVDMEYETALFDRDSVIQLDIRMEESAWEEMLENAIAEEYYSCDVEVNGQKIGNVGIRPKGNTSLSAIAMDSETDRFSLKLEFDHYVEGQTCFGLDKLILNNNYADATNMKEAVVYDMYQYLGADASLYNYAEISLNGDYLGVYLALEAVEDSFLLRNFGTVDGNLYKPEGMGMGGMEGGTSRGGGFSMGSGGADLNYTDDEPDSYSVIWDGEVTGSGKKDHKRVVKALKNISQGTELEKYLDIDNVLKYMAVHTFSVNMDSLSGNMAHNYYLYEYGGKLNIIPWDYNLAFGGMNMGASADASGMINDAIDTPFQGTDFFDALLEDEGYLEEYHEYLRKLTEEYVSGGIFAESYQRIRGQIDALVETDPTAFYSGEEYGTATEMLYETVVLRAESIRGQLDGTIPSTDDGQRADASALVDASSIDIESMGVFDMGGGGFPGQGGGPFGRGDGGPEDIENADAEAAFGGEVRPLEGMEWPDGDIAFGEDFSPPEGIEVPDADAAFGGESSPPEGMERPDGDIAFGEEFSPPEGMEKPDGDTAFAGGFQPPERAGKSADNPASPGNFSQSLTKETVLQNIFVYIAFLTLMLTALLVARRYRRC